MEINPLSFFVLSLPLRLLCIFTLQFSFWLQIYLEKYVNFSFAEFIFVMVKDTYLLSFFPGCSQNLKQVPQNFMEVFKIDDVALTF